ncbi:MAG: peroxidase, partial [Pseudomonadota bacterium]
IQNGLDFNLVNNTCPLLGDHTHHTRHSIPSDPKSGRPPYVMDKLKTFVETRGGDYFFIPSLTALRMIGMGVVDPT